MVGRIKSGVYDAPCTEIADKTAIDGRNVLTRQLCGVDLRHVERGGTRIPRVSVTGLDPQYVGEAGGRSIACAIEGEPVASQAHLGGKIIVAVDDDGCRRVADQ